MTLNDRARISGDGPTGIGTGGALTANIECVLYGGITSYGNVTLKDRTVVNGNIFTHGTVTQINQPVINGFYRENMPVELFTIPTYTVTPGSTDKNIASNGTLVLAPGNYRDLTANAFSTLRLSAGVYQFRKFIAYTDVHIKLDAPSSEVIIRVANEYSIGDRTHIESYTGAINPLNIQWYTHQSTQVEIGTNCNLIGAFTAPNYTFKLGARSVLKGAIYAKSIILDPDAKVEKCNDTRYVDSDFDDVPDIVETAMGTNPSNRASTPEVAKPSSWYADPSQTVTVHYDLSKFPGYFSHTDVPIVIPAGVNTRAYNPIISIVEPEEIGVPFALPVGNKILSVYELKAGIASSSSLMFGFPLPGASIDLQFENNSRFVLQHYNENTHIWETIPIDHITNNVAYANITSASTFNISIAPFGIDSLNNLRVFVSDNPATVLAEKNFADVANDFPISDEQRLEKIAYSFDQFRTVLPQMRYRFVNDTITGHAGRANLWLYWLENSTAFETAGCYPGAGWVHGWSFFESNWENIPNFNLPGCAKEHNTIFFRSDMLHYTMHGTDFVAREEIYHRWNDLVERDVFWREFIANMMRDEITLIPWPKTHPENDVFHPAGNLLTGGDMTWVIRHELGHCFGLGVDRQQSQFVDPATSTIVPAGCVTGDCATSQYGPTGGMVTGQCRHINDDFEGLICYEDGFSNRAQHHNDNLIREFDARDFVNWTDYVVSYPYTRMFVRMQNRDGVRYNTTNWYDVRYRMFETPFTINAADNNPQRFFVMGLDTMMVSTAAGSTGASGDIDGPALTTARLNKPQVLFIDETNGNLYFGVYGKIKMLSAAGAVTTYAGTGVSGYLNGPRLNAQFDGDFCAPFCRDAGGNIYVCERNVNRIRRINASGDVILFAGSDAGIAGNVNATGSAARFNWPSSMCIDATGNLYVADYNNHVIRRITPLGEVTNFAGTGIAGNVDGPVATAQFRTPCGIAIDAAGNLYVSERDNFDVRFINMAATPPTVTLLAGDGTSGYVDGPALTARFGVTSDLHVDARGIVYVADAPNNAIRKIFNGSVSTIAGRPGDAVLARDGCGTDARFNNPNDVAADTKGNIYVAGDLNHTIRKISTHIPLSVNAPALGARLEDISDAVWVEFTVTDNISHTLTITPDPLLIGAGVIPVPLPADVGVDATLFGPDNYYLVPVFNETDGNNVVVTRTLDTGRYLLRIFAHNPAYANGAFSVQVTNTRQNVAVPAAVGASTTVTGNLEREGDNDWFRINVAAAATLTIETTGRSAGLATAPVIYMYQESEGLPVGGVPRVSTPTGVQPVPGVTEDDVYALNKLVRRILRDGKTQISQIVFGAGFSEGNRINELGIYWIRVRPGNPTETGTYSLRVTKNL